MRTRATILLLLVTVAVPAAAATAVDVRAEFTAALERVADTGAADSVALRAYLLYPYVEIARARHALSRVANGQRDAKVEARVRTLLGRHGDEPVARDLLREFLAYLGERGAWREFQAAAPAHLGDVSLRCHALRARLALGQLAGLREAALTTWLNEPEQPPSCTPVFEWLDRPERLSDAEIEQRARFAAQSKLPPPAARAALLPPRRAIAELWDRLMKDPVRGLQGFLGGEAPQLPAAPDADVAAALVEAFTRVARNDSTHARELYEPLRRHAMLDEAARQRLQLAHGLGLAYDHDPDAVKVFDELPDAALDALGHEWRVRAALLHREWRTAERWLQAMPAPQRDEVRWRYWRARLLEKHWTKKDDARALYEQVAREREYYAFLAAERLERVPELRPVAAPDQPALQAQLAALPPLRRARELFECGLNDLAYAELRHALRERPAAERVQAARLAAGWGWHLPAVLVLSEMQQWDDLWLRFPLPYDPPVEQAAEDTGVPAEWLYAVLRTESLYDPRAVSRAGALGLLQLKLATARLVARRTGLSLPSRDDLFRPDTNIALGARYLADMQQRFGGRFALTLAAYNAGPMRIPQWLPRQETDADIWIENIPYNETRTYVQRALSTLVIIGWRRRGEPTPILPLLSPVPAAGEFGDQAS